ncbi:hypothetical protein [Streptomyces sp. NPDC001070]
MNVTASGVLVVSGIVVLVLVLVLVLVRELVLVAVLALLLLLGPVPVVQGARTVPLSWALRVGTA